MSFLTIKKFDHKNTINSLEDFKKMIVNEKDFKSIFSNFYKDISFYNEYINVAKLNQIKFIFEDYERTKSTESANILLDCMENVFDLLKWKADHANNSRFLVDYFLRKNKTIDYVQFPLNIKDEKNKQIVISGFKIVSLNPNETTLADVLKKKEILSKEQFTLNDIGFLVEKGMFVPTEYSYGENNQGAHLFDFNERIKFKNLMSKKIDFANPVKNYEKDNTFFEIYVDILTKDNDFYTILANYMQDFIKNTIKSLKVLIDWRDNLKKEGELLTGIAHENYLSLVDLIENIIMTLDVNLNNIESIMDKKHKVYKFEQDGQIVPKPENNENEIFLEDEDGTFHVNN